MPPPVTYWTHTWDPAKEAISKEIASLRVGPRAVSPVVAFSPANATRLSFADRVLTLSDRQWLTLRAVAALVEPRGRVTHIFGGLDSWHLFRALGRRPILVTAVVSGTGTSVPNLPISQIARVVVEAETAADEWMSAGIPRERIDVVRPGIDLDWYRPSEGPDLGRFRLLFASTPSDPAEIEPRGIAALVELARARPDLDIVVPWRTWGDVGAARTALGALRPTSNFIVTFGERVDMRQHYQNTHATIACFAKGIGKACPNFVIEGLASGRPCISTPEGGLAGDLDRSGAGVVSSRDVAHLSAAVDRVRTGWRTFSQNARCLAEAQFDLRTFRARYEQIYREILQDSNFN